MSDSEIIECSPPTSPANRSTPKVITDGDNMLSNRPLVEATNDSTVQDTTIPVDPKLEKFQIFMSSQRLDA